MSSSKCRDKQVVGFPCYKFLIVLNWRSSPNISAKFVWNPCWGLNQHQVEKHEDDLINNYLGWPPLFWYWLWDVITCTSFDACFLITYYLSWILYHVPSTCIFILFQWSGWFMGFLNIALCQLWLDSIVFLMNMTSSINWHGQGFVFFNL